MCGKSLLQNKRCLLLIGIFACVGLWITNKAMERNSSGNSRAIPQSLSSSMTKRRQLLKEQCLTKPPNPSFIEEADFSRFIVIEKLKLVFCFIPKVSCTTWKRVLYSVENNGEKVKSHFHRKSLFSWLQHYSVAERKEILNTYYKAMFVREPFARLASTYRDKIKGQWLSRFINPNIPTEKLRKDRASFSTFIRRLLSSNETTPRQLGGQIEDQHWRSYEQICPCEVNYDFIGHFENLGEEGPQFLKVIGADNYVTFPVYHQSKSTPYMMDYYSQLTKDEITKLYKLYEIDFKLFGYDFPGPLEEVLKNKTSAAN